MLCCFEEYSKCAEITGFRKVSYATAEKFLRANRRTQQIVDIQFFDADLIATSQHLYFAVLNALQAFKNNINISNSLAMETMLYASAQRQIKKAIERCGIKKESVNMAVVIIGASAKEVREALIEVTKYIVGETDERVLELSDEKNHKIQKCFKITSEEVQTITNSSDSGQALVSLVIERVALLATQL